MPLSDVPDPRGDYHSWAERHMSEFLPTTRRLGIEMTEVRQSERYRSGRYNVAIRRAMERRGLVFDTLAEQQTIRRDGRPLEERRRQYFPFKPYCEVCGRDDTWVTAYEAETVQYTCRHGHTGAMSLADGARISGKLVWKVDWPMRWQHEGVAFEPAGEDHHGVARQWRACSCEECLADSPRRPRCTRSSRSLERAARCPARPAGSPCHIPR
jgi:lysyl-tRNA synthetase class 1